VSEQDEREKRPVRSEGSIVRVLTLDRPASRNALNGELHAAVLLAIQSVAMEPEVRAIVLTGSGDAFSAGGDFELMRQMQEDVNLRREILDRSRSLFQAVLDLAVPIVAAVNGPAVGAGATLALLCDVVLMADDAYLAEPRVNLGLVAGDGGVTLWPLLAGVPAARAYLLTGDRLSAQEAHRLGLIHQVHPSDSVLREAMSLAERLADMPQHAMRATKRALNRQLEASASLAFEFALEAEMQGFDTPELIAFVRASQRAGRPGSVADE
jgi:enoyl-CoA hydratase